MSETSKQRQSRIDLGYYRLPDAQSRRRRWLILSALLIAGPGSWPHRSGARGGTRGVRFFQQAGLASKGPLARPHAMWETNCEACHVPFTPVNGSRWSPSLRSGSHAGDDSCRACHAGPSHHASQRKRDVPSCAECHRDHRGRDASLLVMDDSACTSCHRDLSQHRDPAAGRMLTAATVTGSAPTRPSTRLHTAARRAGARLGADQVQPRPAPGQWPDDGERRRPVHVRQPGRAGPRPIRLDHRPGQGVHPAPVRLMPSTRWRGQRGKPGRSRVRRVRRCGRSRMRRTVAPAIRSLSTRRILSGKIRHGLRPREVVEELSQLYTAQAVKSDPGPAPPVRAAAADPRPARAPRSRREPRRPRRTGRSSALKRLFGSAVDEGVRSSQGLPMGRGGCVECHELTPSSRPLVDLDAASSLEIKPVVVRSLWYESAAFNHAAHRALECAALPRGSLGVEPTRPACCCRMSGNA